MKKRVVKKIANAYLKGRWWAGVRDPYFWSKTSDGDGLLVTEARLPKPVENYLRRYGLTHGAYSWEDCPHVVELWWYDNRHQSWDDLTPVWVNGAKV